MNAVPEISARIINFFIGNLLVRSEHQTDQKVKKNSRNEVKKSKETILYLLLHSYVCIILSTLTCFHSLICMIFVWKSFCPANRKPFIEKHIVLKPKICIPVKNLLVLGFNPKYT